jgi:DNA-directed RNA polymerase subunit RPC12/RpoP
MYTFYVYVLCKIMKYEVVQWYCMCDRCSHDWLSKGAEPPIQCPKCRSVRWNKGKPVTAPPKAADPDPDPVYIPDTPDDLPA